MSHGKRLGEDDGRTAFSAHGEDAGSPRWRCPGLKNGKMDGFPTRKLKLRVGKWALSSNNLEHNKAIYMESSRLLQLLCGRSYSSPLENIGQHF